MKRIEEMIKLIKSRHALGFNVSIFLIVSCLVVLPLLNDTILQVALGLFIVIVAWYFSTLVRERLLLKEVLKNFKANPNKSLEAVNKQITRMKRRLKNTDITPEDGQLNYASINKKEQELIQYEQLKEAIYEEHKDL